MSEKVDLHYLLEHTEIVAVTDLRPHPSNPNIGDQDLLAQSIDEHGQFRAIGISRDGYVLFGNHTYFGAMQAGQKEMLVHRLPWDHMHAKALAIMVADNRAHRDSQTNKFTLAEVLKAIDDDPSIEIEATLYDRSEVDEILAELDAAADKDLDDLLKENPNDVPAAPANPVTKLGDVWVLGRHRLVCGDSTQPASYEALLGGAAVDFVFTSPPYNVDVSYGKHADEDEWAGYRSFLAAALAECHSRLADGRGLCWNIGVSPRTFPARQLVLMEELGFDFWRMIVWDKVVSGFPLWNATTKPVARSFNPNYRHELVYVMSKGKLEKGGEVEYDETLRDDVLALNPKGAIKDIPDGDQRLGSQTLTDRAKKAHPAVFPIEFPIAFINHLADLGGIVLDPFCGSGSTIIAAEKTGRRGFGIELDPAYCDVACRRYQEQTGNRPVLESSGEAVDFVESDKRAA